MLSQLIISNFAIVRELDIDFAQGMSAITGETGAGKSIAIDALGLCLGDRAEADMIRQGAKRASICARFSLKDTPSAQRWLAENQLDEGNECLLRRVISTDGRSRCFINGNAVPLFQLRELGQLLIQIHGQHAHQLLIKPEYQRELLDAWIGEPTLIEAMATSWQLWHQSCRELAHYQQQTNERAAQYELLQYQLKELNDFAPLPDEYSLIDSEYKRLANSEQLRSTTFQTLELLAEGEDITLLNLLHTVRKKISELILMDNNFGSIQTMLDEATIQLRETADELRHYSENIETDPHRLHELEKRISHYHTLSHKHHVNPTELYSLHQQLLKEQKTITQSGCDADELSAAISLHHANAEAYAAKLHQARVHYAEELSELITNTLHQLAIPHGQLSVRVNQNPAHLSAKGSDHIEFLVSTNPGQPLQPLPKVASGGELSRIALAIQVITARKMDTPALIFDEVDVGISGPTAAVVGRMLRQLGESAQVICVTHLPQVAGCGHAHYFVSKEVSDTVTETHIEKLDKKSRLHELARLLGGSKVTRNTLANARELLAA